MSETVEPLLIDLVAFVAREDRPYLEVMDAWRTSCPRLPVWEEANARGLVTRIRGNDGEWLVQATARGRAFVEQCRP
jgi:D-3-phosphoglycerate dehydrogenase